MFCRLCLTDHMRDESCDYVPYPADDDNDVAGNEEMDRAQSDT